MRHYILGNYSEAAKWFLKAAEKGLTGAQSLIGECYYICKGVAQDDEKAKFWLQKAAEQGNEEAEMILEYMDSEGL